MKYSVRLTEVHGDQEEFADLIGTSGVLTLGDRNVYMPHGRGDWLTLDKKRVVEKVDKITVSTKLGNKFVFKVTSAAKCAPSRPLSNESQRDENGNVVRQDGFTQICVWQGTVVGRSKKKREEFVKWMKETFHGARVQYLEEVKTNPDKTGPGGRNDLFFAIHSEDVSKFAVPRLFYGIRWLEDVFGNHQGHLYPDRVASYATWRAGADEGD